MTAENISKQTRVTVLAKLACFHQSQSSENAQQLANTSKHTRALH